MDEEESGGVWGELSFHRTLFGSIAGGVVGGSNHIGRNNCRKATEQPRAAEGETLAADAEEGTAADKEAAEECPSPSPSVFASLCPFWS